MGAKSLASETEGSFLEQIRHSTTFTQDPRKVRADWAMT